MYVEWSALLMDYTCVFGVIMSVVVVVLLMGALPPFYRHKGWHGFYMCKLVNYLWCLEQ